MHVHTFIDLDGIRRVTADASLCDSCGSAELTLASIRELNEAINADQCQHGSPATGQGSYSGYAGGRCYFTTYADGCTDNDDSADVEAAR